MTMQVKEEKGCFDLVDEELGCILSVRKDRKSIVIWQSAVDAMEKDARKKNKENGVWYVIRHK